MDTTSSPLLVELGESLWFLDGKTPDLPLNSFDRGMRGGESIFNVVDTGPHSEDLTQNCLSLDRVKTEQGLEIWPAFW